MFTPNATEKDVRKIELVEPEGAGYQWQGVRHADMLDAFLNKLRKVGWKPDLVRLGTNETGTDLAVAARLGAPPCDPPKGATLWCGLLTSNGRHLAPRLYVGTLHDLIVPAVWGEVPLGRLTTGAVLTEMLNAGLVQWETEAIQTVQKEYDQLRAARLTGDDADLLLMRAGRFPKSCGVTWSYIGKADRHFRHPEPACLGKRRAWTLLGAYGLAARPLSPVRQFPVLLTFTQFLQKNAVPQESQG